MYNLYVPVKFHIMFCMQVLIDWINDVLVGERIIVKDLAEDLYDGQVLQKLFGTIPSKTSLLCLQCSTLTSGIYLIPIGFDGPPCVLIVCDNKTYLFIFVLQRSWRVRG